MGISDRLRQQAEKEKAELRQRLLQQLNTILATRDSARGLIANMSDVLFETGKFELRTDARERLAKVSGIVLAYPGLHLEIEGHTDSVGTDEYNQQLSEHRADAVRDYLVQQGISADVIVARGLGKTAPIASNDTRRVSAVSAAHCIGAWPQSVCCAYHRRSTLPVRTGIAAQTFGAQCRLTKRCSRRALRVVWLNSESLLARS